VSIENIWRRFALPWLLGGALAVVAVAMLTAMTFQQHTVYSSELALWSDVVRKRPDNPRAHHNLGVALAEAGRVPEAIAQYTESLQLKPNAFSHNNLGLAMAQQGHLDEAITHYGQALQIQPNYEPTHYNLGLALAAQGHVDEAVAHFSEALRLNPGDEKARQHLQVLGGVPPEAGPANRMSDRSVGFDEWMSRTAKGIALIQSGRIEEAIAQFDEVVRLNPNDPGAHNNLGSALAAQGRFEEAINHFHEALRLSPADVNVLNNLVRVEDQQRQAGHRAEGGKATRQQGLAVIGK